MVKRVTAYLDDNLYKKVITKIEAQGGKISPLIVKLLKDFVKR